MIWQILAKLDIYRIQITLLFKQLIIILSIVAISGLMVGCQSELPNQNNQVIYLNLWQGINPPSNRDVFDNLVAKFNQTHPYIQVKSIFAGELDKQLPKILTAVVGNVPPDILAFYPQITGQFVELQAITPLEEWFEESPVKEDVPSNLLAELQLDGHLWSVPFYTSNLGIFYRPDLFQEAGITETPKTWEELRQVAKKLTVDKNGDNIPEQYGMLLPLGKEEWTVFSWFPFLLSAGGEIVTNSRPNLTNPGAIAALQFWETLIQDGSATLSPPERGYEEDAFFEGRIAMQITGPWTYITKYKVNYDIFPIPAGVAPATVTGSGNLFLMKTTPEREKAAWKFLEFVLSEEFQTEWAIGTGFLPVNQKSVNSKEYQEYVSRNPWLQVFIDQVKVSGYRPTIARYNRISDGLGRAIEATLLGKSSAKDALAAAQKRLDAIWGE